MVTPFNLATLSYPARKTVLRPRVLGDKIQEIVGVLGSNEPLPSCKSVGKVGAKPLASLSIQQIDDFLGLCPVTLSCSLGDSNLELSASTWTH